MRFPLPPRAISAAEGISFCGGALLLAAPVVFDAREGEGAVVVGSVEAVLGDDCDAGFALVMESGGCRDGRLLGSTRARVLAFGVRAVQIESFSSGESES